MMQISKQFKKQSRVDGFQREVKQKISMFEFIKMITPEIEHMTIFDCFRSPFTMDMSLTIKIWNKYKILI